MVSELGFKSLNIESLARSLDKNKSSFYHYFGDLEIFESELLDHHLELARGFAEEVAACENIRTDMINVFVEHKADLFFHKRLRINRSNPAYKKCFEKVFDLYENAILDQWSEFLGLQNQRMFARTFLRLITENFLLQITQDSFTHEWLDNYLREVAGVLQQMHVSPDN